MDGKIPTGDVLAVFDAIKEQFHMTEILKDKAVTLEGLKDELQVN